MSTNDITALTDALFALQPRAAHAQPAELTVAPLPAPVHAAPVAAPRAGLRSVVRAAVPLAGALARAVLRRPRAKRMALAMLARVPRLHAYALRVVFPPVLHIDLDPPALDRALAARLSPRARAVAYRLLALAGQAQSGAALPAPDDDAAWDRLVRTLDAALPVPATLKRPRLAFVSPLPPQRTGIADYAVQLLPALAEHVDIEIVIAQDTLDLPPALAHLPVRSVAWLRANAHAFDHIMYQVGNSEYHQHMFALLREHPGIVVLHDFFLGNVMAYRQAHNDPAGAWTDALFHSHGYPALAAYKQAGSRPALLKSHPCNLAVLQDATRVIVHSDHAAELARDWYGPNASADWDVVPLPRAAPPALDRQAARAALGIGDDVFLVCSFGFIGQNKLSDRLLAAWLASSLRVTPHCLLVLVGANHASPFGARVAELVRSAGGSVRIAGWSDDTVYRQYLQAADLGVQLRTSAQGETSAAVLDCMNYGLATIVNANGSMAALPPDAVWRMPDAFDDAALTVALETLYGDSARRAALGRSAAALLAGQYRPAHGAQRYRDALTRAAQGRGCRAGALERAVAQAVGGAGMPALAAAASALARQGQGLRPRQLLVDIDSAPPALLAALLADTRMRVEPVRLVLHDGRWMLRYARTAALGLLGLRWRVDDDPLVDAGPGDVFFAPASHPAMPAAEAAGLWTLLRTRGVALAFAAPAGAGMGAADLLVRGLPATTAVI